MKGFWNKLFSWCSLPVFGLIVTANYLLGATYLLYDRIDQLNTMQLNEIGDFLAGIFGALAFFWLVIGYFMQNKELKNQIIEIKENTENNKKFLELQEKEFRYKLEEDLLKIRPIFVEPKHQPNLETQNILISIKNIGNTIYQVRTSNDSSGKKSSTQEKWEKEKILTIDSNIDFIEFTRAFIDLKGEEKPKGESQFLTTPETAIFFTAENGKTFKTTFSIWFTIKTDHILSGNLNPDFFEVRLSSDLQEV